MIKSLTPSQFLSPHSFFFNGTAIVAGSFSRHGGVSQAPFHSLNVSYGVGDYRSNVDDNRSLVKMSLKFDCLVSAVQIHGDRVHAVRELPSGDLEIPACDALITNIPGIALMIQQADCQAVLLHDPVRRVVAAIHAGWRGTVANIIPKTVAAMREEFSTDARDLLAGVSPSLGPCCAEFVNFREELPKPLHCFENKPNHFDFWAITRMQLETAGVLPEHISVAGVCTVCSPDYFSYRRERLTGRCASAIGLKEEYTNDAQ